MATAASATGNEALPHNRTIFDDVAEDHADVTVIDGAEVDLPGASPSRPALSAAVRHAFDHFAKAHWMTRDPAPKAAVDAVLKKSLDAGDY